MKTAITLSLLALFSASLAEAAIPRRVELTGTKWCAERRSEDRVDHFLFDENGKLTVRIFHANGSIDRVETGSWKIDRNKLNIRLGGRSTLVDANVTAEGKVLSLSSGMRAESCGL